MGSIATVVKVTGTTTTDNVFFLKIDNISVARAFSFRPRHFPYDSYDTRCTQCSKLLFFSAIQFNRNPH